MRELRRPALEAGAHARANGVYLEEHDRRLRESARRGRAVFLLVSLRDPERDVASYVSQVAEQRSAGVVAGAAAERSRRTTGAC